MRHAVGLTSPKLSRLHNVLLDAKGEKLSSLELTTRTRLVAISTWISHLRFAGVKVEKDHVTIDGDVVYRYWIKPDEKTTPSVYPASESSAGMLEMPATGESARESMDAR